MALVICSCTSNAEKDEWAKEVPEIKYSEKRENELWGSVLRDNYLGFIKNNNFKINSKDLKKIASLLCFFRFLF